MTPNAQNSRRVTWFDKNAAVLRTTAFAGYWAQAHRFGQSAPRWTVIDTVKRLPQSL